MRVLETYEWASKHWYVNECDGLLRVMHDSPQSLAGSAITNVTTTGYIRAKKQGHYYQAHRILWILYNRKDIPEGCFVDHIDGNRTNNLRENLRLATPSENNVNATSKGGSSSYKGVSFNKARRKWQVNIRVDGAKRHGGYFDNEELAHEAYLQLAKQYHGEFANEH